MDRKQGGFTLAEVLVSIVIIGIATITIFSFISSLARQTTNIKNQTFATQKAIQIMEELRSLVGRTDRIGILDNYDDFGSFNPFLTTENTDALGNDPSSPLSGNVRLGSGWRYLRQVSVVTQTADPYMRRVSVNIYLAKQSNPSETETLLAQSVSVIKTSVAGGVATQVMDVYLLCLENIPGWWTSTQDLRPMADALIGDIQIRNPGLEIKTHWITRLSYGRDPYYTPYINEATRADILTDIPFVYYYPGLTQKRTTAGAYYNDFYYYPDFFSAKINVDSEVRNVGSYGAADQYNNAVRYPEEEEMYARYGGEMSLRMLLEKMNSSPTELTNIIILNLHGELLPLPPLRNYSDAAKDPISNPNVRVVTHPESLSYRTNPPNVKLRVYSYVTDPGGWADASTLSKITICFPEKNFIGSIIVTKYIGNASTAYSSLAATVGADYTISFVDNTTVLVLNNSPLRHAQNGNYGLPSSKRLYELEYIPCPIESPPTFAKDLAYSSATSIPRNTARWIITIAGAAFTGNDGMYTVDTRIGDQTVSGYPNFSRTYFWVGTTPPYTEQYQFMGDPRHCPYADIKTASGYNWYFAKVNSADYAGFGKTVNGWVSSEATESPCLNVPRYFQLYRNGLLMTNGIFSPVTGWSFFYVGVGGEMGGDGATDYPDGIPVCRKPWAPATTTSTGINEIDSLWAATSYGEVLSRVIAKTDNSWYGRYWIGELCPDSEWTNWLANGNLATGTGNFYRARYTTSSSWGLNFNPGKMTGGRGCVSWTNGLTSSSTNLDHSGASGATGNITTDGNLVAGIFNFPPVTPINAERPFRLDSSSNRPPEWSDAIFSSQRTTISEEKNYYNSSYGGSYSSSKSIKLVYGTLAGYTVIQGLSPQTGFGAAQISRQALQGILHQFLVAGEPTVTTGRIVQLPLASLSAPSSGEEFDVGDTEVNIQWSNVWKRWDEQKYTTAYADGFAEIEPIIYNLKYSNDNGSHWYFMGDDVPTSAGAKDLTHSYTTPYVWDISAKDQGTYLIRLEAYRQTLPLHYNYHQLRVYRWR